MILAGALVGCGTTGTLSHGDGDEDWRSHPRLRQKHADLLRSSDLDLSLLDVRAVRVEVLDRVPVEELVFVESSDGWRLLLADKALVRGWREVLSISLGRSFEDLLCTSIARTLADDLTRLLLDPNERYGLVVSSPEEIPTDYPSSDVFRDLLRQGLAPEVVHSELLQLAPSEIQPPRTTCGDGVARIEFYAWHYFGGEVVRWMIEFSPRTLFDRQTLATEVGSYDYYY